MGLIREINETMLDTEKRNQQLYETFVHAVESIQLSEHMEQIFETARDFIASTMQMVRAGNPVPPEAVAGAAAKLAAFEVLADNGTSGTALDNVGFTVNGSRDPSKKLLAIMKKTSASTGVDGPVDQKLVQMANLIAKSAVKKYSDMLSTLDRMDEKQRTEFMSNLQQISRSFDQLSTQFQQAQGQEQDQQAQLQQAKPQAAPAGV